MRRKLYLRKAAAIGTALVLACSMTACGSGTSSDDKESTSESSKDNGDELVATMNTLTNSSESGDSTDKEETVYVIADSQGKTKEVVVSEWLKNLEGSSTIEDATNLTDIKNVKGDESYKNSGSGIVWESNGSDIYYQGKSNEELPVSVKVTYYLDGKQISPDDLLGKSGKVKIRYDYTNNSSTSVKIDNENSEVYTPFVMATGLMLPTDTFKNVTVSNGEVLSEGNNIVAFGVAMPGLADSLAIDDMENLSMDLDIPDYFEVTADVEDFSLGMSVTFCSNTLIDMNDFDMSDSMDDINADMDELTDGADQLVDGSTKLADGTNTLKSGTSDLAAGGNTLKSGTSDLEAGTNTLKSGTKDLAAGTDTLKNGTKDLAAGTDTLKSGTGDLANGTGTLKSGTSDLANGTGTLKNGTGSLASGVNELYDGVKTYTDGVSSVKDGAQQLADGSDSLDSGADSLATGIASAKSGSEQVKSGLESAKSGSEQLKDGLGTLNSSAPALLSGIVAAQNGLKQIIAGYEGTEDTTGAVSGAKQVAEGLAQLEEQVNNMSLPDLSGQSSTLTDEQKAAVAAQIKDYLANDETGKAALAQSTTEFITNVEGLMAQNGVTMDAQTTAVLEAVIKGVFEQAFTNIYISAYESGMEKGMGEVLSEVSAQLDNYSPMITQLQSAAGTLASGSAVVADGVNQLYEGTKQLGYRS